MQGRGRTGAKDGGGKEVSSEADSQPLRPNANARGERKSAVGQIHRSLRAWRAASTSEGAVDEKAGPDLGEAEPAHRAISAKLEGLSRKVFRAEKATDPMAKAKEVIARVKSVTNSLPELNKLGLSQEQMKEVLLAAYAGSNRNAIPQKEKNGDIVLLSQYPGTGVPVAIIKPSGQASIGSATIEADYANPKAPLRAINIKG